MTKSRRRWIVASNRLPFKIAQGADGAPVAARSSGGLVTALNAAKPPDAEGVWVGSAPDGLRESDWTAVRRSLEGDDGGPSGWSFRPAFLDPALYDRYYNGFCNDVLWPLFHYEAERARFAEDGWQAYQDANRAIAEAVAAEWRPGDLAWVHDFHLFLVPSLLKKMIPEARVGFFLHVPFPSAETFRQLPARAEILSGVLAADLVGFHDYSYLYHFCTSCMRLLGLESTFLAMRVGSHVARLGVFPVSIDVHGVEARARGPETKGALKRLPRRTFQFLGVDRLDYVKGVELKLQAFRAMLARYPETRGRATLLQVAIPTREGAPDFQELAAEVARLVGEINGDFSTPAWTPVQYIHNSVDEAQLLALYRSSRALLVTSKRDGMNLVALEYVASQSPSDPGVVLLSEFAGALSLLSQTLAINPWDIEGTARKMREAMEMPERERQFRMHAMQRHLRQYTARDWAQSFMETLASAPPEEPLDPRRLDLAPNAIEELAARICADLPERIALMVDYDGTLVPIETSPELAVLRDPERELLRELGRYPWLDLMVVSGRDSRFMDAQFDSLVRQMPLHMAAEHGARYFDPAVGRWRRRVHRSTSDWYPAALKIMSDYAARVPGSLIERKRYSIAWHYRRSPAEYGDYQSRKLFEELEHGLANRPAAVVRAKMAIEVRATEADKGAFANWFLESRAVRAFALALGDDRTDEDLFSALGHKGLSFKVGPGPSHANFVLKSQDDVAPFLRRLLDAIDRRLVRTPAASARRLDAPAPAPAMAGAGPLTDQSRS